MNDLNENQNKAENIKIVCSSCGKEIDGDADFCPQCGKAVEKLCPNCGTVVTGNFCTSCGADTSAYFTPADEKPAAAALPPKPVPDTAAAEKKSKKKVFIITGIASALVIVLAAAAIIGYKPMMTYLNNKKAYEEAAELFSAGSYEEALTAFQALGSYNDSAQKAEECSKKLYQEALDAAVKLYDDSDYEAAIEGFKKADTIIDTDETDEWIEKCNDGIYQYATEQYNSENYEKANEYFKKISGYKDADDMAANCSKGVTYLSAVENYNSGDYDKALELFNTITGFSDADEYITKCNNKILFAACKKAYINYINKVEAEESSTISHNYAFIYIDGDNIPELYVEGKYEAEGDRICSYYNGTVTEQKLNRIGGLEYIEYSGLAANFNGNMGYYILNVYKLSNGTFTETASGLMYEDGFDESGSEILYSYKWDDEAVSEDDFLDKLDAVFDTSKSKSAYDAYKYTANEAISYLNSNF